MQRLLLPIICAVTLLTWFGCSQESTPPELTGRPNILFLLADDQRADTIAAWGNDHIQTPHLDSLAASGFSFLSNYNMGANGGAVCVPSRAMINTGLAFFRVGNDMAGKRTLPELLQENSCCCFCSLNMFYFLNCINSQFELAIVGIEHGQIECRF